MATKLNESITYKEKVEGDLGELIITGLTFPKTSFFDPLAEIWSSVRKRIMEQYNVDATGLFKYKNASEEIVCVFHLNYGVCTSKKKDFKKHYTKRYEETFATQMMMLEEVIDSFVLDYENGYEAYSSLINNKKCTIKMCEHFFNTFLRRINMRTKKDEIRSVKKKLQKGLKTK